MSKIEEESKSSAGKSKVSKKSKEPGMETLMHQIEGEYDNSKKLKVNGKKKKVEIKANMIKAWSFKN